jgi:CheY-like chemotaxis protein
MGLTVVIVEDHRLHARLLEKAISTRLPGSRIETFADGGVALARLQDPQAPVPDLLVFDLDLPGCSGHALLTACARDERLAVVPAAIVTASDAPGDRERSLALGARLHLAKPVDGDGFTELAERLAELIRPVPAGRPI